MEIEIKTCDNLTSSIIIERGLKDRIESIFDNKKYFLITNTTIKKLYPKFIKKFDSNNVIVIKDGEKYKNYKTFSFIVDKLLEQKIERKDCIVALGGGVVGDLAGYCASSVLRGVELIQIPTTLLAMCDSSIGGKTGFNTKFGKNLIGSFYLASKVLIDSTFLNSLNDYEYKCGLGEVLKYAFIEKSASCDTGLLGFLTDNSKEQVRSNIDTIIESCASIKAQVVNKDRLEGGLRKILNFGHTYAHAFETLSNYKGLSHGQAVSIGIQCAAKLSYNLNMIDSGCYQQIVSLLNKFELINKKLNFPKESIINLMKQDKKVIDGKINLLVPTALGQVELFDNIDLRALEASLP